MVVSVVRSESSHRLAGEGPVVDAAKRVLGHLEAAGTGPGRRGSRTPWCRRVAAARCRPPAPAHLGHRADHAVGIRQDIKFERRLTPPPTCQPPTARLTERFGSWLNVRIEVRIAP